jgi:hypothetical protein
MSGTEITDINENLEHRKTWMLFLSMPERNVTDFLQIWE